MNHKSKISPFSLALYIICTLAIAADYLPSSGQKQSVAPVEISSELAYDMIFLSH